MVINGYIFIRVNLKFLLKYVIVIFCKCFVCKIKYDNL